MSSVVNPPQPLLAANRQKYVVCLPTYGRPYITSIIKSEKERLRLLCKAVEGPIQKVGRTSFIIHPMFRENTKWNIAQRLLQDKDTEIFVNEEGMYECVPNMATVLTQRSPSGCPHYFGDIALVVKKKALENICDPMTLQVKPEDDPDLNEDEEEDEEEEEKEEEKKEEVCCGECGVSTEGRKIRGLWNNLLCEKCGDILEEEEK